MNKLDHWFYASRIDDSMLYLEADEARHATKVLRLKQGNLIQCLDGNGHLYVGRIEHISRQEVSVVVQEKKFVDRPLFPTLGVGILHDRSRLEWLVEKSVELGVCEIVLLDTERTERSNYKMARLEMKALGAMKQSKKAYLPTLRQERYQTFVSNFSGFDKNRWIAHCYEEDKTSVVANDVGSNSFVLIGPEGDFTRNEIDLAKANGFNSLSLGTERLRTETAAIACLAALNFKKM